MGEGNRLNIVDVNALGCQLVEKPPGQGRAISGVDQYSSAGGADGEATGIGVKVAVISKILAVGVPGFGGNGGEKSAAGKFRSASDSEIISTLPIRIMSSGMIILP